MPVTVTNLIQGPADLYRGDFGAAEPTEADISMDVEDTTVAASWTDLGGTQDGVTLTLEQEYAELEVDQIVDVPESRLTKRVFTIKTNFAEPTLENFKVAANGGTITAGATSKKYTPAMDNSAVSPDYSALLFDGIAPASLRRRVIARKVLNTAAVEQPAQKDGQTLFPVELKGHYVSKSIPPFDYTDELPPVAP
ncbi:hypothetical protein [Actinomadura sp. K4S16]|uniref:hypothetical protein n=1 Tax=Actinomadura sp. K4S16 TaxID=1316147 RepID=UPI0011EE9931|nr:hypothetical protein [Actinomadura sp. K4S16]